jgi:hypothetical protein
MSSIVEGLLRVLWSEIAQRREVALALLAFVEENEALPIEKFMVSENSLRPSSSAAGTVRSRRKRLKCSRDRRIMSDLI